MIGMSPKQEKRQVLVVGLGRFGSSIAKTLCAQGVQVLAIERNLGLVEEMRDLLTHVVQADSMDRDAMEALGVGEFDTAFVTIGADIKASCVTTMLLKELGVEHVMVKAADEFHGRMLEKLGADKVLYPERDMGRRIAHNLISGKLLEYIELSPDFSMAEIRAQSNWSGRTLSELHLRDRLGINVIAVRSGEAVNPLPTSDTVLHEGDLMLVVAEEETLMKLNQRK